MRVLERIFYIRDELNIYSDEGIEKLIELRLRMRSLAMDNSMIPDIWPLCWQIYLFDHHLSKSIRSLGPLGRLEPPSLIRLRAFVTPR